MQREYIEPGVLTVSHPLSRAFYAFESTCGSVHQLTTAKTCHEPEAFMREETIIPPGVLSAAEKEMAAFVCAVNQLLGSELGQRAAEYWLEILDEADWSFNEQDQKWRLITIAAASRLTSGTGIEFA